MLPHNDRSKTPSPSSHRNHAVAVLVITPEGVPLVRDPKKPAPVFWKVPGGRSTPPESARAAAVRELREELGITFSERDLELVREEDRGSHLLSLFTARLEALPSLKARGDEGEEIRVFQLKEILALRDFFPNHRAGYETILRTETQRKE